MANKKKERIPPYQCIESLRQFNELLFGYKQTYRAMIAYIEAQPTDNQNLKNKIIEIATDHQNGIDEFYPE